MLNPKYQRKL